MYTVDGKDVVHNVKDIPQSSGGAPLPHIVANENRLILVYYVEESSHWDGMPRSVNNSSKGTVALIKFENITSHIFGLPNDEAFSGHPLEKFGLQAYGAYWIENSSWIRILEKMNRVHPSHDTESFFSNKKHFILSFHDTTFECIASEFVVELFEGSITDSLFVAIDLLNKEKKFRGHNT